MPYANLVVAQSTAAYFAAPYLVSELQPFGGDDVTRYFIFIVAMLAAVIVLIAGLVGSRISKTIARPSVSTAALTVAGALGGSLLAAIYIAPSIESSTVMAQLFTLIPVVTAVFGYMLARGTRPEAA